MSAATALLPPIVIDDAALTALGEAGYRWKEGTGGRATYHWLLPSDWVETTELPARPANGIQPLCGAGDRGGRLTAVLGVLRGCDDPPEVLVTRGASAGARFGRYDARNGRVAQRLEVKNAQTIVTTAHAFVAGGEAHRFLIASLGPGQDAEEQRHLRLLGLALALRDTQADLRLQLGGRLHG